MKVEVENVQMRSPLDSAPFFSRLTFSWMNPLFKVGSQRPLEESNIYALPRSLASKILHDKLQGSWNLEKKKKGEEASLMTAAFRVYAVDILLGVLWLGLYSTSVIAQPYIIEALLNYFGGNHVNFFGLQNGFAIAAVLGGISLVGSIGSSYGFYSAMLIGIAARCSTMLLIFEKSLSLSNAAKSKHTTGQIVTLMSADAERLLLGFQFFPWFIMAPVLIIIAIAFLVLEVDYSIIGAILLVLIIMIAQILIGFSVGKVRQQLVKVTDDRVKVMNECLQGIRVVKFYAWEVPVAQRVNELRNSELVKILTYLAYKTLNAVNRYFVARYTLN